MTKSKMQKINPGPNLAKQLELTLWNYAQTTRLSDYHYRRDWASFLYEVYGKARGIAAPLLTQTLSAIELQYIDAALQALEENSETNSI
jgi:hypothetical protein